MWNEFHWKSIAQILHWNSNCVIDENLHECFATVNIMDARINSGPDSVILFAFAIFLCKSCNNIWFTTSITCVMQDEWIMQVEIRGLDQFIAPLKSYYKKNCTYYKMSRACIQDMNSLFKSLVIKQGFINLVWTFILPCCWWKNGKESLCLTHNAIECSQIQQ